MKEKAKLIQPAKSALAKLGADLKRAHRRRRLSMALPGFAPFCETLPTASVIRRRKKLATPEEAPPSTL